MELSDFAIKNLVQFVTGDNKLSINRKGPDLVDLFKNSGLETYTNLIMEGYPNYQIKRSEIHLVQNIQKID